MEKTILISGSSDIGESILKRLPKNSKIISTYNNSAPKIKRINLVHTKVDMQKINQIDIFAKKNYLNNWTNLILLPATQLPIGTAEEVDPSEWLKSINLNFTHQIYLLLKLLKKRSKKNFKRIILWSGTGSNNAPKYYSAYTVSKIALTKITELFDAELNDCVFSVIGPGWVKTKIHNETLQNKFNARENYYATKQHFKKNIFNSMSSVVNCVFTLMKMSKEAVGGRNFSAVYDPWEKNEMSKISNDKNAFKLRRNRNDFFK